MARNKVSVMMSLKEDVSRKAKSITSRFRKMGRTGSIAMATIRKSADGLKRGLKGLGSMGLSLVRRMKQLTKVSAALAVAGFAYSTKKAMEQEDAVLSLKGALLGLDRYTRESLQSFKAWASQLQEQSLWGDEQILQWAAQASAIMDTNEQLKQYIKIGMGLSQVVPMRGADPVRLATYAKQGVEGTNQSLNRYINGLDEATTKQERLNAIMRASAAGWGLIEERTEGAKGTLTKFWNVLGDVQERFAAPFLKPLTKNLESMRTKMRDSQKTVLRWGYDISKTFEYAKTMAVKWWDATNWKQRFQSITAALKEVLLGGVKMAVSMGIAAGRGIWSGLQQGLGWDAESAKEKAVKRYQETGGKGFETVTGLTGVGAGSLSWERLQGMAESPERFKSAMELAQRQQTEKRMQPVLKPLMGQLRDIAGTTTKRTGEAFLSPMSEGSGKTVDEIRQEARREVYGKNNEIYRQDWRTILSEWTTEQQNNAEKQSNVADKQAEAAEKQKQAAESTIKSNEAFMKYLKQKPGVGGNIMLQSAGN